MDGLGFSYFLSSKDTSKPGPYLKEFTGSTPQMLSSNILNSISAHLCSFYSIGFSLRQMHSMTPKSAKKDVRDHGSVPYPAQVLTTSSRPPSRLAKGHPSQSST